MRALQNVRHPVSTARSGCATCGYTTARQSSEKCVTVTVEGQQQPPSDGGGDGGGDGTTQPPSNGGDGGATQPPAQPPDTGQSTIIPGVSNTVALGGGAALVLGLALLASQ